MGPVAVYEAKAQFVKFQLAPFQAALTGGDVAGVWYERGRANEFVLVRFAGGYDRRVCVTGDSHKAMARDVLAAI